MPFHCLAVLSRMASLKMLPTWGATLMPSSCWSHGWSPPKRTSAGTQLLHQGNLQSMMDCTTCVHKRCS